MTREKLYKLVDKIPTSKWNEVIRYLKVKARPTEVPSDQEIEAIRKKNGHGEFYKHATREELKEGFKRVNERIMNRPEFNEVFEVNVSEERWVSLKTYLRDLNQPDNMPTADEIELFRLFEFEKDEADYLTLSHEELLENYIEYNQEKSIAKVMTEDLFQLVDHMSLENLKLLNDYAITLEENKGKV